MSFLYFLRVHTSVSNTCSDMFFTSFLFTNIRPPFSSCLRFPADGAKHVTAHVFEFPDVFSPKPISQFFQVAGWPRCVVVVLFALALGCVARARFARPHTHIFFIVSFPKHAPPVFSSCGMAPVCCIGTPPPTQLLDGARRCSVGCLACARLAHPHVNNVFLIFIFYFRCPNPPSLFKLQDGPGVCHCCCCCCDVLRVPVLLAPARAQMFRPLGSIS